MKNANMHITNSTTVESYAADLQEAVDRSEQPMQINFIDRASLGQCSGAKASKIVPVVEVQNIGSNTTGQSKRDGWKVVNNRKSPTKKGSSPNMQNQCPRRNDLQLGSTPNIFEPIATHLGSEFKGASGQLMISSGNMTDRVAKSKFCKKHWEEEDEEDLGEFACYSSEESDQEVDQDSAREDLDVVKPQGTSINHKLNLNAPAFIPRYSTPAGTITAGSGRLVQAAESSLKQFD